MAESTGDVRPLDPVLTGFDEPAAGMRYRRPGGVDHHLLVLTLKGAGWIGPAAGRFEQRWGDLILIDPRCGVDQDVDAQSWKRIWILFDPRPHWHDWLGWPELAPGYRHIRLPTCRRGSPVRDHLEMAHRHAIGPMRRG